MNYFRKGKLQMAMILTLKCTTILSFNNYLLRVAKVKNSLRDLKKHQNPSFSLIRRLNIMIKKLEAFSR